MIQIVLSLCYPSIFSLRDVISLLVPSLVWSHHDHLLGWGLVLWLHLPLHWSLNVHLRAGLVVPLVFIEHNLDLSGILPSVHIVLEKSMHNLEYPLSVVLLDRVHPLHYFRVENVVGIFIINLGGDFQGADL